jgi:hypothetical protein
MKKIAEKLSKLWHTITGKKEVDLSHDYLARAGIKYPDLTGANLLNDEYIKSLKKK